MKGLLTFLTLQSLTTAYVNFEDWLPPTTDDLRSPCPALNALANHGLLPRDGRMLTVPLLVETLGVALNFSAETATVRALDGIKTTSDPASGAFTLGDLNKHGIIEHDGSLSRKDNYLAGEAQVFCPSIFAETLSFFKGATNVGFEEIAAARWGRIQASKAANPQFAYNTTAQRSSYSESAAYFQVLKDPSTNKASVEWIKIFFSEERLPYKEGWRPTNPIDGKSFLTDVLQIAMHTPERAPGVSNATSWASHSDV
ncbi:Cloroperoxidase [Dothidotthia symphoricarpi CBS 119687]|uniref:Cloroperoxidase n=1 Tax=Dothidotthia symphoricarpi CBS 119687 TaxID=1392245 RepID=A0A6A6AMX6_9PLEO|nr:Cloroperoxidase [Dothidotthia symphoricarpi CBS 119687]KAF2132237.1 Cloroperoxidase [Dothidotthia symphoricarpi CBS 119687]